MRDHRSPEAQQYRKLYMTKRWRMLREQALLRDLFRCTHNGCNVILTRGVSKPNSAVVHHIKPHKGNLDLFFDLDNLASVCWAHHSGAIQIIENRGFDVTIGQDGWPIDPKHPAIGGHNHGNPSKK
jgi:5-methylcytosine-specific restriction protein A